MNAHHRWLKSSISRRGVLLGAAALAAAVRPGRAQEADAAKVVRFLCWGGYDEARTLASFRDQTGIAVQSNHIGANDEIFLRLRAGGLGRYDLVTPQNGVVRLLAEAGLIQPLDLGRLTRTASLLPVFQQPEWAVVEDRVYAVPFLWGAVPMIYNAGLLDPPPASWLDLQSQDYRGRIAMHDDGLGHFKIWNRVLGAQDPTRVSTATLTRTANVLISIKSQQVAVFTPSMGEIAGALARGEALLATVGWASAPRMEAAQDANLQLAYPLPGTFSFCDSFCLAANAPNVDGAYAFIDHMLSAAAQAAVAGWVARGVVAADAVSQLDPATRALHPYEDLAPFFQLNPLVGFPPTHDDGSGLAIYVDWVNAWERVRYARMEAD